MKRYNPRELEPKWQKIWDEQNTFKVTEDSAKPKKYIIDMFPYPSGAAMHVGHVRNFTISDVLSQFHRQKGYNVMHTMGWDTFGLPAENYAIKTGTPPAETTKANIANFKHQLQQLGMSYDWSREINTSDPSYYRWTQWIFTQLFKKGLAYQKESPQWWCPVDKTVLANEQVEAGKCWRCGNEVVKKNLKQWFFKITDYADALLSGIDDLDWPEKIKTMQRNWIGKSQGAEIDFKLANNTDKIKVFTTRPDTIFGATFMVLAPEHKLVSKITTPEQKEAVDKYVKQTQQKSELERQENKQKTGVFTGAYAINPANNEQIPVWLADYVLTGYGTGAIMAVPAHDERDHEFAQKFELLIKPVIIPEVAEYTVIEKSLKGDDIEKHLQVFGKIQVREVSKGWGNIWVLSVSHNKESEFRKFLEKNIDTGAWYADSMGTTNWVVFANESLQVNDANDYQIFTQKGKAIGIPVEQLDVPQFITYHGEGVMVNSGKFDGQTSAEARENIVKYLEEQGLAKPKTQYKMRDWLISRQRYWGAPIPIVHCPKDGAVAVPDNQLPVELPPVKSFEPTGEGSVLDTATDWVNTTCPTCGGPAKRETDTMDGYACSSWYFLRYADPKNDKQAWDPAKANYWLPVDYYCGGDHAVSHLLYSRFWFHFFADLGLIQKTHREPVGKLVYNGYILAADGNKMSKSKGNTVNPDDLIEQGYGADSVRLFEMFIAPYDQNTSWNTNGVPGTFRFLQRVWALVQEYKEYAGKNTGEPKSAELEQLTHGAIKRVTAELEHLGFNTSVAALMEFTNGLYVIKNNHAFIARDSWQFALTTLTQLLAPFAPHVAEELWADLGQKGSVHLSNWPLHDEGYLVQHVITIAVQVNGKLRGEIEVPHDATQEVIELEAKAHENVASYISGDVRKVIYIPGKIINFVV